MTPDWESVGKVSSNTGILFFFLQRKPSLISLILNTLDRKDTNALAKFPHTKWGTVESLTAVKKSEPSLRQRDGWT